MSVRQRISIRPGYFSLYYEREKKGRRAQKWRENVIQPELNNPGGIISDKANKRVRNAIDWLVLLAQDKEFTEYSTGKLYKFKINFVTLTLASKQVHSDQQIKAELLNQFLIEARKKWNIKNYLWRAESQENGNIHFHVVTDQFIPWKELRNTWNRIQNKLGYVSRYQSKMQEFYADGFKVRYDLVKKWDKKAQKKAYKKSLAKNFLNPNSTDVHSIKKIRNIAAYLAKYCSKNPKGSSYTPISFDTGKAEPIFNPGQAEQLPPVGYKCYRVIGGKLWGLSQSMSRLKSVDLPVSKKIEHEINQILRAFKDKTIRDSYYTVCFTHVHTWRKEVQQFLWLYFNRAFELWHNTQIPTPSL